MVKFNKQLNERKVTKWKDKYLNYKLLKQAINQIYITIRTTDDFNNQIFESREKKSDFSYSRISAWKSLKHSNLIKDFFDKLDNEIQNFYFNYSSIEKELFQKLNVLMKSKEDYAKIKGMVVKTQCENLYILTLDTRLFNDFIFINLEAIRKIMKKFDKKIKPFYNDKSLMLRYIKTRLDYHNSDLNYILKMKIFDELVLLIDNLIKVLSKRSDEIENNKQYDRNDENVYKNIFSKIKKYSNEIQNHINTISVTNNYRIPYLNLAMFLDYEQNSPNDTNLTSNLNEDDFYNYNMELKKRDGSILITKKFLSLTGFNELKKINKGNLSDLNRDNVNIMIINVLLNSIMKNINYLIYIPFFNRDYNIYYIGICLAMIFLGNLFSTFFLNIFSKSNKHFKLVLLFNILLILCSNLMIIPYFQYDDDNSKKYLYIFFLSKFIFGLGSSGKIERQYLMTFLPKNILYLYIKRYNENLINGKLLGMIIGILFIYLTTFNQKNSTIYVMSIILSILNMFTIVYASYIFRSPSKAKFSLMKKKIKTFKVFERLNSEESSHSDNIKEPPKRNSKSKEEMSQEEIEQVDKNNEELGQFNLKSKFTDSNLIKDNVNNICYSYKKNLPYLLQLLTFHVCISEFILCSINIIYPITLFKNQSIDYYCMVIPLFLFNLVHKLYNDFYSKQKFILSLLHLEIVIFFSLFFIFIFPIFIINFLYVFIVFSNMIIQRKLRRFIAEIFPDDFIIRKFKSNSYITFLSYISSIIGSLLPYIIGNIFKFSIEEISGTKIILFYTFYVAICFSLLLISTVLYHKKINYGKMKLFSRILKNNY